MTRIRREITLFIRKKGSVSRVYLLGAEVKRIRKIARKRSSRWMNMISSNLWRMRTGTGQARAVPITEPHSSTKMYAKICIFVASIYQIARIIHDSLISLLAPYKANFIVWIFKFMQIGRRTIYEFNDHYYGSSVAWACTELRCVGSVRFFCRIFRCRRAATRLF